MQRCTNLWETFLLQVCNDALPDEIRRFDYVKHFLVVIAQQSELEPILCGVNVNRPRSCRPIQTVHSSALDASEIDWVVQGANDTSVSD